MNQLLVTFKLDGGGDLEGLKAVLNSYIKHIGDLNVMRGGASIRTVQVADLGGVVPQGKVLFESGEHRESS